MTLQHSISQDKEFFLAHNSQKVDIRPSDLEIVTEVRREAVDNGHSHQDDVILQSRSSDIVHLIINNAAIRERFEAKLQNVNARVIWPDKGETRIRLQYHEFQFQPMIGWRKDAISFFDRIFRKFSVKELFLNQIIWNDVCRKLKRYCETLGQQLNVTYYRPKNQIFLCGLKNAVENAVRTIDEIVNDHTPNHERRSQANQNITALHRTYGTEDNNTNTELQYATHSDRYKHLQVLEQNELHVYQHVDVQTDVPSSYSQQNKIVELEVTRNHVVFYDRNGSIARDTNSRIMATGPINQTLVEKANPCLPDYVLGLQSTINQRKHEALAYITLEARLLYSAQTQIADSKSSFDKRRTHVIQWENSKRPEMNQEGHKQQTYLMSAKNIDNQKEKYYTGRIITPDNPVSCRTESATIATKPNKKVNTNVSSSCDVNTTKRQRTKKKTNSFLGLLVPFMVTMVIMPVAALPHFPGYHPLVNSGVPCQPKLSESSQPEDLFRKFECYIPTCTNVSKIIFEKTGVYFTEHWTPVFEGITKTNYSSLDIANSYTLSNRYDYYAFQTNHILYINPSTLEDNGKWRCVVVDAHNITHESNPVKVQIHVTPVIEALGISPVNPRIVTGENYEFTCSSDVVYPKPYVVWHVNGIEYGTGTSVSHKQADKLWSVKNTISIRFDFVGNNELSCLMKTKTMLRRHISIDVKEAAMISIPATDMKIALQQTSTFVLLCSGAGYRPNLRWEKDGIHIPHNDERYIIQSKCDSVECTGSITQTMGDSKSACLHIEDYAGIYTCVISLELPYDSSQVSHQMRVYAPENLCNAQGTGLVIGLTIWSSACVITTFIIVAVMVCLIKHRGWTSKDTDQISKALEKEAQPMLNTKNIS